MGSRTLGLSLDLIAIGLRLLDVDMVNLGKVPTGHNVPIERLHELFDVLRGPDQVGLLHGQGGVQGVQAHVTSTMLHISV